MKNKTYNQIEKEAARLNKKDKRIGEKKIYVSRTKLNFCKNDGCNDRRRHGSAYCGKCIRNREMGIGHPMEIKKGNKLSWWRRLINFLLK